VPETAGAGAGSGSLGEDCPRPSAYVCLRQQGQLGQGPACRAHTHGHRRPARVYRDITRPPQRFVQ
jgi:hypothetical protein